MNRPATLKISFLATLLLLCGVLSWIGLQLALPRSEWVEIGRQVDFSPSDQPYEVRSPVHVFVVNDGNQILVLDPMNHVTGGVNVKWNTMERAFIDPSRGSWFDLRGIPLRRLAVNHPMENQSLSRYEVNVENGWVYIDLNRTYVEKVAGSQQP